LLEHHADAVDHAVISGVTVEPMPNRIFLKPQLWIFSKFVKTRRSAQKQAQSMGLPPRLQEQFVENLMAMSMESYRNLFTEIANFSISPALQHVDNTALIVAGGKEVKIILQSVKVIPDLMPNAQGRIAPGYGHGWNVEAPALFSDMVRAWVSDQPLPTALQTVKS
jgi:pimeloyl-ACP methyl ester carboxylesterase